MTQSALCDVAPAKLIVSQATPKQMMFDQLQTHYHAASLRKNQAHISFESPVLNKALGGGLLCRRVHLLTGDAGLSAPVSFGLALVAMMLHQRKAQGPIVWCGPVRGGRSGQLFGAGLADIGVRPERIIFVRESHPLRRMAACEEALTTPGLAAVINEYGPLCEKADLWQKSARRLQLACEKGSASAFMIGKTAKAAGFESAWKISSAIADDSMITDWRPVWQAQITHARGGYPTTAHVRWDRQTKQLQQASHSQDKKLSWQAQPYRAPNYPAQPYVKGHIWRKTG